MSFVETSTLKNSTIMYLHSIRDEININPPYQRMGSIWTLEKRRLLIDSLLNDYDIPKIYFHAHSAVDFRANGVRYSVIDGRQRLETIWGFLAGEFSLADDFDYQRDPSVNLNGLRYADIAKAHPKIKVQFDSFVLPVITVAIEGDEIDLIEDMFSRLNEAVPLNAAEKRNAIGGNMVRAITELSGHDFFSTKVKFKNNRYQHREGAAKLLLIEDAIHKTGDIIDTKKVYLDALARSYKSDNFTLVASLMRRAEDILGKMSSVFAEKDELLQAQGIIPVYYLLFRHSADEDASSKLTRRAFLDFRQKLSDNRNIAINNYENASFDLLEFERLNQQGTNDASSIRERYKILSRELGIDPTSFDRHDT